MKDRRLNAGCMNLRASADQRKRLLMDVMETFGYDLMREITINLEDRTEDNSLPPSERFIASAALWAMDTVMMGFVDARDAEATQ